jgi:hypothetical protein
MKYKSAHTQLEEFSPEKQGHRGGKNALDLFWGDGYRDFVSKKNG